MSHKKRQHYISEGYLRNFSSEEEQLFVFEKNTQRTFKTIISNICSESFFYDIPPEFRGKNTKTKIVEDIFSDNIENNYAQLNRAVIENIETQGCITADQKENLAYYITMQILRTRKFRDEYIQLTQIDERVASVHLAEALFNPEHHNFLINVLNSHIWIVGKNETERPFYTSDSPIVRRPHKKHPERNYSGYNSVGIEIAFPLSSKYIIAMYERSFFEKYALFDYKVVPFGDEQVWDMNHLQVLQCDKRVFSISDQFEDAKALCERFYKERSSS